MPESQVQSYTSALLAVLAGSSVVFSPISGILADRVSTRQAPFLFGLSTLIGATILLFLATTIPVLTIARVLQGISSAVVWTLGLAICIETVGPENLGKTIGSVRSCMLISEELLLTTDRSSHSYLLALYGPQSSEVSCTKSLESWVF